MSDIFISYAQDLTVPGGWRARSSRAAGRSGGTAASLPGGDLRSAIERELSGQERGAPSKDSIESEWTKNEATAAAERNVLVPALLDDVRIPLEFRRKQTANLIGWEGDASHEGFQALCEGIGRRIGAPSVTGALRFSRPRLLVVGGRSPDGGPGPSADRAVAVAAATAGALWWASGGADQSGTPRHATRKPPGRESRWTHRGSGPEDRDATEVARHHRRMRTTSTDTSADRAGRRPSSRWKKTRTILPAVFSGRRRENRPGHPSVRPRNRNLRGAISVILDEHGAVASSPMRCAISEIDVGPRQNGDRIAEAADPGRPGLLKRGPPAELLDRGGFHRRRGVNPPAVGSVVPRPLLTRLGCVGRSRRRIGDVYCRPVSHRAISNLRRFLASQRDGTDPYGSSRCSTQTAAMSKGSCVSTSTTQSPSGQQPSSVKKKDEPRILRIHNGRGRPARTEDYED